MTARIKCSIGQLLNLFQETWAERDAYRVARMTEESGQTANWDAILQACRSRAEQLFQPAVSGLQRDIQVIVVVEQLLKRLEKSLKAEGEPSAY